MLFKWANILGIYISTLFLSFKQASSQQHKHEVELSADDIDKLKKGTFSGLLETTNTANGHNHDIKITYKDDKYRIEVCDNVDCSDGRCCRDKHGEVMTVTK